MNMPISDKHLQAALGAQFGVATIASAKRKADRKTTVRWDCGRYGMLTPIEVAKMAGISRSGAWARMRSGIKGADLCMRKSELPTQVKERCSNTVVLVAVKLARAFPGRVPSVKDIRATHPMCRRNAQRWRQAFNDARNGS